MSNNHIYDIYSLFKNSNHGFFFRDNIWLLLPNKKNYMDTHLFPNLKVEGVPKILRGNAYSVKYNDIDTIKNIIHKDKDISAIVMEVMRDEKPKKNYLKSIRSICNKNNICLIFDECTSGFRESYADYTKI